MALNSLPLALAALLAASPLMAKDKPINLKPEAAVTNGAVALYAMAQGLYTYGMQAKDPFAVLSAAKLTAAVQFTATDRKKETKGPERAPAEDLHKGPVGVATMLAAAHDLAGEDETMIAATESVERDMNHGRITSVATSRSTLKAGKSDAWQLALFGDTGAELAVVGDGDAPLSVLVTDENGHAICQDPGGTAAAYCSFTPAWNGVFTVTVQNLGKAANSYVLLSN